MRNRAVLWVSFLVVHGALAWLCLNAPGLPLGDVTLVYKPWVGQAMNEQFVVGIDTPWVYPLLAIVPMLAASVAGFGNFGLTWLVLVTVLDLLAFSVLVRGGRRRRMAAWWWIAGLACLGPIALARVDAVTVPLAIVGALLALRYPALAGAALAVATWMKVWPAALIASLVIVLRARVRIVLAGVAVTIAVVGGALALGSGWNVFSFLTEQTGRGLQIEAPLSMVYLWQAALGVPGFFVYYDREILTFQVTGTDVDVAIALATPLLIAAVLSVALIGIRADRMGAARASILPALMLALVAALIVFNKVGSPQFMVWLFVPVIVGLVIKGRDFVVPAAIVLAMCALTQVVYPYLYSLLLNTWIPMLVVLTVRNIGTIVLLGWAVAKLWRAGSAAHWRADAALSTLV
ncbi:glycosyltransferase 87 family protein [Paramicrobacterium fandaimingii]|uniref:glycosyltransferase 87 family protein n=1 Tax=Paramicrobacterium fandaimingii TaxID=2708079 RepID=UPI0014240185|nr:glycosyltransferase 87 family protein [Microbacterium fandaimingii]